MKSAIALFVLLMGLWLLSSGIYTPMIIGFGVASCAVVVAICWRMRIVDPEGVPVHLTFRGLVYLPWLVVEIVKANVDVVRRVLAPSMPISPTIVVLDASQKTDLGRVFYANSITLTPGTVSIEAEGGTVTVHSISKEGAAALEAGEMDRRVTRMEGAS